MPDTMLRKDPAELARDAGAVVVNAGVKLRDGISNNRTEMTILASTMAFAVLMAVLGIALISVG